MAGTLTISTLSDGTNSTSSTNCIRGSARAWVNWVGTNGTINSAYNVSSVTRTGTGTYTINFTTAFADTKYALTASTNDWACACSPSTTSAASANTFTTTNGANRDNATVYLAAFA